VFNPNRSLDEVAHKLKPKNAAYYQK